MAITLKDSPVIFTPVYNQLVYIANSTNKAECNFRYVFDVYINLNFVTRLKVFPFGNEGFGTIDISRIVQDYLTFDINQEAVGFERNSNSVLLFNLQIGEEYDNSLTCSDGVTVYPNLLQTDLSFGWNAAFQYTEWPDFNYEDYMCAQASVVKSTTTLGKFLTHAPDRVRVGIGDMFAINFFHFSDDPVNTAYITTYDKNFSILDTATIENIYDTGFFTLGMYLLSFGCGPVNLNNATISGGSATQPMIDDDVYFYSVQMLKDNSPGYTPYSELKIFEVDKRCTKYERKRLMWLNRLGGFDSYSFSLRSDRKMNISRTEFTKKLGSVKINSPNANFDYSIGDRGRTNITVDASNTLTFNSNWMSEEEALWIEELFTSPEVYLVEPKVDNYNITSVVGNFGVVTFFIDDGGNVLPNGTAFTYVVNDGSPVGMDNQGSGIITSGVAGQYETTVPATIPAGASVIGTFSVVSDELNKFPMIITSTTYDEKIKTNIRNINYQIELQPSYKVNVQRN